MNLNVNKADSMVLEKRGEKEWWSLTEVVFRKVVPTCFWVMTTKISHFIHNQPGEFEHASVDITDHKSDIKTKEKFAYKFTLKIK